MMNIKIDKYRNDAKWSLDYFKEDITAEGKRRDKQHDNNISL